MRTIPRIEARLRVVQKWPGRCESLRNVCVVLSLLLVGQVTVADTVNYQYDTLGRLKTTTRSSGAQTSYSLDPTGNRTQVQTTGVTTPSVPPTITVPQTSTGSYIVSWGAASGVVTAYELYESTNSGFASQSLAYSGTGLSLPVTSKPIGTYYYRVRACNGTSCSGYLAGTNPVVVSAPTGPVITLDDVSFNGEDSLGTMNFTYGLTSTGSVALNSTVNISHSTPAHLKWITPQTGMNLYQAQATSACPFKTGTYSTWQTLGTTRTWGVSLAPNKSANCTITVDVSAIANPTVILDSTVITVELSTVP